MEGIVTRRSSRPASHIVPVATPLLFIVYMIISSLVFILRFRVNICLLKQNDEQAFEEKGFMNKSH